MLQPEPRGNLIDFAAFLYIYIYLFAGMTLSYELIVTSNNVAF